MKVLSYRNFDLEVDFRNPAEFVDQWWWSPRQRRRAVFVWLFWLWRSYMCNVWVDYGVRVVGVEISLRRYLGWT